MSKSLNALKRAAATTRALDDGDADSLGALMGEVVRFHKEQGFAPALSDVGAALGWSKERTRDAVRALLESGHLAMRPGVGHSLRVATDEERIKARAAAWYSALSDLPAIEVAAARAALERLAGAA